MNSTIGKTCKDCNACKALYRIFWYRFDRDKLYLCTLHVKLLPSTKGSCESWHKKELPQYDLSPQRFDEAKADLMKLRELLSDR